MAYRASKDIKLSCTSRSLNETLSLIKTETGYHGTWMTMILRKRHASKMEYLAKIHDGSAHEIGDGY